MTPSELNTRTFRLRTRRQHPTIKMQYRLRYSHQIRHHCSLSVLIFSPDARNSLMPSEYTIQTSHISASTLKVPQGSALRGGYCHDPEYLHFIMTILPSILDFSDISLQIIFSYPFCTAYYGLMIFRTITCTVTQPYSHCT